MAGIGIILNRNAGKHQTFRSRMGTKLAFVLGAPDSLREPTSEDEIDDVVKSFSDRDIDILGIGGGDGSNHYTISALVKLYGDKPLPKIVFLCGGTHNAHALSVGMRGTPEAILKRVTQKYHNGESLDLLRRKILHIDDGNREHYGFSMATGFMFRFYEQLHLRQDDSPVKVAAQIGSWLGSFAVHGKTIRDVFRLEPGRITISGKELPWESNNGISCSSMEKLGLGFTPYPRANEEPGKFQAAALRIKVGDFIRLMWHYKRGRVPDHPDQINTITDHVRLEAENAVSYVVDGEIYEGTNQLEVRTGPGLDLILA